LALLNAGSEFRPKVDEVIACFEDLEQRALLASLEGDTSLCFERSVKEKREISVCLGSAGA
jgi:hypothetical protein